MTAHPLPDRIERLADVQKCFIIAHGIDRAALRMVCAGEARQNAAEQRRNLNHTCLGPFDQRAFATSSAAMCPPNAKTASSGYLLNTNCTCSMPIIAIPLCSRQGVYGYERHNRPTGAALAA